MEELMERIRRVLSIFCYITTAVTFATAVYIAIFWGPIEVSFEILWQILGTSFICSLGMLIISPGGDVSRRRTLITTILYYCYVNVVVLTAGFYFEWFYLEQTGMVVGMVILIAVVFTVIYGVIYLRDKALADRMTQKLRERER